MSNESDLAALLERKRYRELQDHFATAAERMVEALEQSMCDVEARISAAVEAERAACALVAVEAIRHSQQTTDETRRGVAW